MLLTYEQSKKKNCKKSGFTSEIIIFITLVYIFFFLGGGLLRAPVIPPCSPWFPLIITILGS